MLLSLAVLTRYEFNQRRLTEADFYEICATRNIEVQEIDVVKSFYLSILGRETIVIDKKLKGVAKEFARFHELSHAMLSASMNGPKVLFMGMCDTKEENEADAFAAIALIPKHKLADTSFMDDCCCGTAQRIYEMRLRVYEMYNI